mgnify:CR=1 FL=1
MAIETGKAVGELVRERLGRARVFERLGIDYCCHGRDPLARACGAKGLDVAAVVAELERSDAAESAEDTTDYNAMAPGTLADHIEASHHAYLRRELPRLDGLLGKVVAAHGAKHPEVHDLRRVFNALSEELDSHLLKEERILFPLIKQLEAASSAPRFHCGSVNNPIRVMEHEHDSAGAALERIRALTDGYRAPSDACATFQALVQGLADLEADLHRHIHKENNILFPRAAAMEAALQAGTPVLAG